MDHAPRPIEPDQWREFRDNMGLAFGWDHSGASERDDEAFQALLDVSRTRAVFDGDAIVATLGAFDLELTVPGSVVRAGGTSFVSVRPTHRRRGVLRALMKAHIEDVRERGEPMAALWASESSIYGRFGYGVAAQLSREQIDRAHTAFARPFEAPGRLRFVEREEAQKLFPPLYDRLRLERPGCLARNEVWWRDRKLLDSAWGRGGASPLRHVAYEEAGELRGWLSYRSRGEDDRATLLVDELFGADAVARTALHRFTFDVDLIKRIVLWNQPVDGPLRWLLADPRKLERRIFDSLWVRLVDVAESLSSRRYACEGALTLRVRDADLEWNDGSFRLEAAPDGARCDPAASGDADVELDVADLGAAYLGGARFGEMARAGRIEASPEAAARADTLFGWDRAPWCPEIF